MKLITRRRSGEGPVWGVLSAVLLVAGWGANAFDLNIDDPASIKNGAKITADAMMTYYSGNKTGGVLGMFPFPPYYWWMAGAAWGALIDYWWYTGNTEYNGVVTDAMIYQASPNRDFLPVDQELSEGNDDQAFWALAAMSAAENKFPDPPAKQPQWLALAQAVFNQQAGRWQAKSNNPDCGGGLIWQIYNWNNGYDYKNTITNGCFFQLSARLGRYTGNQTYTDWADKTWTWMQTIGLITPAYEVYDGAFMATNCTTYSTVERTYNHGVLLLGAATMWNITQDDKWRTRTQGLLTYATKKFFTNESIMWEASCESPVSDRPATYCNTDQKSFKGYLARWMAATTRVAPWTYESIMPLLRASAQGAAKACSGEGLGEHGGLACGIRWTTGNFDGNLMLGQQMSALEVVQSNLSPQVAGPVTQDGGGTSKGDSTAGTNLRPAYRLKPVGTAGKVGGWIVFLVILALIAAGTWWLMFPLNYICDTLEEEARKGKARGE